LSANARGIAKAKGEGKYKGRAPTARAKTADICRLAAHGATRESIATHLGVSVRSVYRVLGLAA
jgi:DNA invertase Pin-like site-specific DNA recombinase